jgi:hypothetical protein
MTYEELEELKRLIALLKEEHNPISRDGAEALKEGPAESTRQPVPA